MKAAILLLGLFAAPAAGSDQFDLVCSGTLTFPTGKPKPYDVRYRIDLDKMAWCSEDCHEVRKIVEAQSGKIVLVREAASLRSSFEGERSVDRVSGKLTGDFSTSTSSHQENAKCVRADFSGMPARAF
ncbi:MAG: hypothetical protein ACTMKV_03340 [Sphingomonas parapaucimobilis]